MEWLNAHRGQIPDESGVRAQIEWIIESERAAKREEYVAGFSRIPADRFLPMPIESYLLNFGQETGCKNTLRAAASTSGFSESAGHTTASTSNSENTHTGGASNMTPTICKRSWP